MNVYFTVISIKGSKAKSPVIWTLDKKTNRATCTFKCLDQGKISIEDLRDFFNPFPFYDFQEDNGIATIDATNLDYSEYIEAERMGSRTNSSSFFTLSSSPISASRSILLTDIIKKDEDSIAWRKTAVYIDILVALAKTTPKLQSYKIISLRSLNMLFHNLLNEVLNKEMVNLHSDLKELLEALNTHYIIWAVGYPLDNVVSENIKAYFSRAVVLSMDTALLQEGIAYQQKMGGTLKAQALCARTLLQRFYSIVTNENFDLVVENNPLLLEALVSFTTYLSTSTSPANKEALLSHLTNIENKMLEIINLSEQNKKKSDDFLQSLDEFYDDKAGFYSFKTALKSLLKPKVLNPSTNESPKNKKNSPTKVMDTDILINIIFDSLISIFTRLQIYFPSLIELPASNDCDIFISDTYMILIKDLLSTYMDKIKIDKSLDIPIKDKKASMDTKGKTVSQLIEEALKALLNQEAKPQDNYSKAPSTSSYSL